MRAVGSSLPPFPILLACCLALPAMLDASLAQAVSQSCTHGQILVQAADAPIAEIVCAGAGDAVDFLSDAGLEAGESLLIHVVDALPPGVEPSAAGCYVQTDAGIYLLAPAVLERMHAATGIDSGPLPYRSMVAHEVAHAIAANNFLVSRPSVQAHEYIAYVTMYAAMPPATRELILAGVAGDGFDGEDEITETIYFLAPHWFGVQVYRHYLKCPDRRGLLKAILAGQALRRARER
ncbi:DUF6639 family protein [Thiorhodococcus minor]|uniref:Zinc metallopeptidase n=1 Tax=Thiorhodococcus minor TaxID=57489 RepID=A0A6M0JV12_9GAMM|nr:DUF6639 family protein [Thiorhodococcus minor]NEV61378.1 hypothetical protein [Thiorhodococcus minor]